ncbi:unnamed protein product [Lactuca virosa]|uniref:Uncharacterized protein n=1 Tax=Lactuca virosa TaxID=75947 RepID=A0AAU9MUI5_9ASTR|nr:unnamed protein product [Lactuca virosa]
MDAILQGILHCNDDKGVEDVEHGLKKTLDEVGDAMVAILKVEYISYVDGVMEVNEGGGLINDGVEENEGDGVGEYAGQVAGEGEGDGDCNTMVSSDGDCVSEDDGEGDSDVEDEDEGNGEDDRADMEGNDADDEGHVPFRRPRKPLEMIILQKLKKPCFDKDGMGSTSSYPTDLE